MRALILTFAVLLTACASAPRLTRPPVPPPADATFLTSDGGVPLFTSIEGPGRLGVVWFVVGPEVMSTLPTPRFVDALHDAGFATAVVHARGTGFSDGLRGDAEDLSGFLADQRAFFEHLAQRFSRIFLLGQSVGAAFALELAARPVKPLAGLVLVNPAWRLQDAPGMTPSLGDYFRFALNLVFRPSALTVDMNSRPEAITFEPDREEGLAMQRDPIVVRYFSMRYLSAQRAVMDRCPENLKVSQAPLLLVQGAHDGLVDPKSFDELLSTATTADKQKLLAPDGGHGSSAIETRVEPLVRWLVERAPGEDAHP